MMRVFTAQKGKTIMEAQKDRYGVLLFVSMLLTLLVVGGAIAGSGHGVMKEVVWKFEAGGAIYTTPAITGQTILFGCADNQLYALDLETGKERWRFEAEDPVHSSPAVSNGTVYFGSDDFNLYAVDVLTGEEKWKFETEGELRSSPAISDGVVWIGSLDGYLYALDSNTGVKEWRYFVPGGLFSSPAVSNGAVYFANAILPRPGYLYAVDIKNGERRWKSAIRGSIMEGGRSPVLHGDRVYLGNYGRHIYAIDARTGKTSSRFKMEEDVDPSCFDTFLLLDPWSQAAPLISDEIIYFGTSEGYFYAVRRE